MSHQAKRGRVHRRNQNASFAQRPCQARGSFVAQSSHHDVRAWWHHLGIGARGEGCGEACGILVIFGHARDQGIEGDEARRRQNSSLAHAAAELLANPPRVLDEIARAEEQRPHGAA